MSINQVKHCREFLIVLLTGEYIQSIALLNTLNERQIVCVVEVLKAITTLRVSNKTKKLMGKSIKLVSRLLNSKSKNKEKLKLIQNNTKIIYEILHSVKNKLIPIFKSSRD